jgi:hypothetical protein
MNRHPPPTLDYSFGDNYIKFSDVLVVWKKKRQDKIELTRINLSRTAAHWKERIFFRLHPKRKGWNKIGDVEERPTRGWRPWIGWRATLVSMTTPDNMKNWRILNKQKNEKNWNTETFAPGRIRNATEFNWKRLSTKLTSMINLMPGLTILHCR